MKNIGFFYLFMMIVAITGLIGWVLNIATIATSDFSWSTMLIIRVVGIFVAPLGAVLGYL